MNILTNLLSKGYFPKELPPVFTTESFARVVTQGSFSATESLIAPNLQKRLLHPKKGISNLCRHNLMYLNGTKRPLHIPHPSHFYYLCEAINDSWSTIKENLRKSTLSITKPKLDHEGIRAFVPENNGASRPKKRIEERAYGNILLVTDVTNFYGSIYTHSIPWALHSKEVAKSKRSDDRLLGNIIDKLVMNGQNQQTSGIPIGTDVSFVISEVILSEVDKLLCETHPEIRGFRFYDDYEIVCEDEQRARTILAHLENFMAEYELSLNQRKTKIVRLPEEIDHTWLTKLRQFNFGTSLLEAFPIPQVDSLVDFANLLFSLSKEYKNDPVLRYGLVRVTSKVRPHEFWEIYQDFLIQVFRSEPQIAHLVAGELLKYSQQGLLINKKLLGQALQSHILRHISSLATNEVAWALWMAILFDIKLSNEVNEAISNVKDNIVIILALDAQEKGLFAKRLETETWQKLLVEKEIYSANWLVSYELASKGWLNIQDGSNYIMQHPCFGALHRNKVQFYDESIYTDTTKLMKLLEINVALYNI